MGRSRKDLIAREVHAEVERWKALHDAELERRKRWTWASAILGVLAVLGLGVPTFRSVVEGAVGEAVEARGDPYFAALDDTRARVQAVADRARAHAVEAREAAERAAHDAEEAADQVDVAVDEKLREIAESGEEGAIRDILEAVFGARLHPSVLGRIRVLFEDGDLPLREAVSTTAMSTDGIAWMHVGGSGGASGKLLVQDPEHARGTHSTRRAFATDFDGALVPVRAGERVIAEKTSGPGEAYVLWIPLRVLRTAGPEDAR